MIINRYFYILLFFIIFFTPLNSDSNFDEAKDIFNNKAMCNACHTLSDAGSKGTLGPNLDHLAPSKKVVINAVTNGIGMMPSFQDQLSFDEIKKIANYVSKVTNK